MNQLVIDLNKIPAGTRITIQVETVFGGRADVKVTTTGKMERDGFMKPSGVRPGDYASWSAYADPGDEPCYKVRLREYKKKNDMWVQIGYTLKSFKMGW